jgi:hypothetical protein
MDTNIPKVGRVDCYALKRSEFGRSDDIPQLKAVTTCA